MTRGRDAYCMRLMNQLSKESSRPNSRRGASAHLLGTLCSAALHDNLWNRSSSVLDPLMVFLTAAAPPWRACVACAPSPSRAGRVIIAAGIDIPKLEGTPSNCRQMTISTFCMPSIML